MTRDEVVIDLRAGKTDKAMYNLKIMLKMDEHNDDLWGLLGLAELLNSNIRESEHAQKQALRFAGSKNRRYKHLGNLAVLYIENGREKEARELLDQNWQWSSDVKLKDQWRDGGRLKLKLRPTAKKVIIMLFRLLLRQKPLWTKKQVIFLHNRSKGIRFSFQNYGCQNVREW